MAKKTLALILTVLLALAFACPVFAETTIEHPKVIVYGDVTKTVYPGRNIFEYKDDQGLSSVLPFERQDKNISITFSNIVFDKNFENQSIALATETKSSGALAITKDFLTENDAPYIYLKLTNSSALSTDTTYYADEELLINDEPTITNDYYLLVTAKVSETGDNLAGWRVRILFYFTDSGANTRRIDIMILGKTGTDSISSDTDGSTEYILFSDYGNDNSWKTVQFKIQDLLDSASKTWNLVKLTKISYRIILVTGSSLDSNPSVEARIRHALVLPSKVYIDDPQYENSQLVINGTTGNFGYSADDIINIYGANATKITDVTIPWQWEITPEIETDAENLQMQYTWTFTMSKSPSGEGDSLTFSNTNITLYGYKDGDTWDMLYLNGVDKLSSIASKKVDETTGYWTYGLASSLTEGNMYQIIARITYTADEYDSLTEAPVFWTNPVAWIQYKFWELITAIASFLGLGTAWAVKQKRKVRTPKR